MAWCAFFVCRIERMGGLAFVAVLALVLASGKRKPSYADSSNGKPQPQPQPEKELRICEGVYLDGGQFEGIDYIELVTGGADPDEYLPMIIALHGLGQDKEYLADKLSDFPYPARIILPDAFYDRGSDLPGRKWWTGYSPQGFQHFLSEAIPEASDKLAAFVAELPQCVPTVGYPIMAGHSQGGYIALDFAASWPRLISASVPSAAWRPTLLWDLEPEVPVYAIHGENDDGVPYDRSVEYYVEMNDRGLDVYLDSTSGAHRLGTVNLQAWFDNLAYAIETM
jgi:phospholipase/carboxylesterase